MSHVAAALSVALLLAGVAMPAGATVHVVTTTLHHDQTLGRALHIFWTACQVVLVAIGGACMAGEQ